MRRRVIFATRGRRRAEDENLRSFAPSLLRFEPRTKKGRLAAPFDSAERGGQPLEARAALRERLPLGSSMLLPAAALEPLLVLDAALPPAGALDDAAPPAGALA